MKQTLLFFTPLFLNLLLLISSSQEALAQQDWQSVLSQDGIQVFSREVDIADHANGIYKRIVVFRFENANDYPVDVSWSFELSYNGNCITCDNQNGEHNRVLALDAGQVFEVNSSRRV